MKKLLSFLIVVVMVGTLSITPFAYAGYGEEWEGYIETTTSYKDLTADHWAFEAINECTKKGLFGGYEDGTFRPNGKITRAEAAKVFVMFLGYDYKNFNGTSSFYDVDSDAWYAAFVEAGKDLFPVHTTAQGKKPFRPDIPVTREDTIYALVNALNIEVEDYVDQSGLNMFTDQKSISKNLRGHFAVALKEELVSGYDDSTIRAQASLTRAEFATLIARGFRHGFHEGTTKIEKVTVYPSNPIELTIGETAVLTARATYTDAKVENYTELNPYDDSMNGVISLSGRTITALKEGSATIKFNNTLLKNDSVTVTVKKPTDAPLIKFTNWNNVTDKETMSIKGIITDKGEIVRFEANGLDIIPDSDGSFSVNVNLNVGMNKITFTAENEYGIKTVKSLDIERKAVEEEPKEEEPKEEFATLIFDADGGSVPKASMVVTCGKAIGDLPTPTRNNYTWKGWFKEDGSPVNSATIINESGNIILKAIWSLNEHIVNFDPNGGKIQSTDRNHMIVHGNTVDTLPNVSKEGFEFLGWFDENGNEVTTDTKVTADMYIRAYWWSDYIKEEALPADVTDITNEKWTYTLTTRVVLEKNSATAPDFLGYKLYDTKSAWGKYGAWSAWQDASITSSDSVKVETQTIYPYCYFLCSNCGYHSQYSGTCPNCSGWIHNPGDWRMTWSSTPWKTHNKTYIEHTIDGKSAWNAWNDGQPKTQYRSATRTLNYSYYYESTEDRVSYEKVSNTEYVEPTVANNFTTQISDVQRWVRYTVK